MNRLLLLAIFSLLATRTLAQSKKGELDLNLPLTPYTFLTSSYYLNLEYFNSTTQSTTFTVGHQGSNYLFFAWSNAEYSGNRIDIGRRWYFNNNKNVRFFSGINGTLEHSKLKLDEKPNLKIPRDSLSSKGISFGPEINAGVKIVFFKKIVITPAVGLRYYFSTLKTETFTKNPIYWAYDDWNNGHPNWEENRKQVDLIGFRKGLVKIPYFNVGFILKF